MAAGEVIPSFGALLRRHRLDACLTQATLAERAGLSERAVQHLERGAGRPYRETARRLAEALALPPEVRVQFEAAATPAPRRRAGLGPPAARPAHNLPVPLTPFVGRERELTDIEQQLRQPDVRLLTLVGAGGMGKTRLALEMGRAGLDTFTDGVFLVGLAPLVSASAIVPALATALGVPLHGGNPRQTVLDALRDKHLLLILDNFEHLLNGVDIVVELLQAAPRVKIVATSRERLNLSGEHLYVVEGMGYAPDATLADAADAAAVRLFVQSVRRVLPEFSLGAADVADVLRICQLVRGMPLGLELAAAWVDTLPLGTIGAAIARSADFLTASWRDVPDRHRSIRAVFDWSWRLLDEAERRAFKQLAVFRGGFSQEAAQVVAGASLPVLTSLVRKSLLRRGEGGRYEIHELVCQFAAEQLDAVPGEREAVEALCGAFYLALAEAAAAEFYGPRQVEWLDSIERDHDNIRAALERLAQHGDGESLLRLAGALWYFWFVRGYHSEGRARLLDALTRPQAAAPTTARATALNAAGYLQWVQGEQRAARAVLAEAVRIARSVRARPTLAFGLCYLVLVQGRSSGKAWIVRDAGL